MERVDLFATTARSVQGQLGESPAGPIRYPVSVFRAIPNNGATRLVGAAGPDLPRLLERNTWTGSLGQSKD